MGLNDDGTIINLIHSFLTNQASGEDIEKLLEWVDQSDNNKKQFIEYRKIWMLTSRTESKGKFHKAKYDEWKKLSDKLSPVSEKNSLKKISTLQKLMNIAAVFLIIIAAGAIIAWINATQKIQTLLNAETYQEVVVPFGGKGEVILPDGSKVKLNAGSSLSYSNKFGISDRDIKLEGEGYFEVETNPRIPFVVETTGIRIKAFGTIFNVKAYPDEDEIITTLVEGLVKIEGDKIDVTMTPSQRVTYIKGVHKVKMQEEDKIHQETNMDDQKEHIENNEIAKPPKIYLQNNVNIHQSTAWKDGVFIFNSESLSSLSVKLERKYDVIIDIESDELKDHKFTGTFHQETLEQILDVINLSAPINYKIEKGVVIIKLDEQRVKVFKELSMN